MTEFRSLGLASVLAFGLALSGCAGQSDAVKTEAMVQSRLEAQAQQQVRAQLSEYQNILADLRQTTMCVTAVEGRPEFKALKAHAPKDGPAPPKPEVLTDRSKASAAESKSIAAFLQAMTACKPNFAPLTTPATRNIVRMIADTWTEQQELYGQLKDRKIGWGAFNQATRSNSDKLSGALKALRLTNEG